MAEAPPRLLERVLLVGGIAAPVLYFGTQIVAAQFYPGYDFHHQVASDLGGDGAPSAALFNAGALATGIAALIGAVGVFLGLRRERVHWALAGLVALCFVSHGASAINAALHPLPDPQHNPGPMMAGMFVLPVAAPLAFWFVRSAPITKAILLIGLAAFGVVAAVMSHVTPIEPQAAGGAWQRVVALAANLPVFVVSLVIWLRAGRGPEEKGA